MNNNVKGIVLRQSDYKDNDMILSVFSEEKGKISFYAKGIKKANSKNASSTNIFSYSYFYYDETNKSIQLMKKAERITLFHRIYEDLLLQAAASIICECVEKIEDVDSSLLFNLLYDSLYYLNENKDPFLVLSIFLAEICKMCGITPNVNECNICKNKSNIASISLKQGGFVCLNCLDDNSKRYSEKMLKTFRYIFLKEMKDFHNLEKYCISSYELVEILLCFVEEYSGIHIKGKQFLDKIVSISR